MEQLLEMLALADTCGKPEVAGALRSGAGDLVLSQLEHLVADAAFVAHREGFGAVVGVRLQELFA